MSQLNFASAKVKTIVANITITGAASASGKIRITATGHGLETGDIVQISGLVGTTEGNGQWVVTRQSSSTFDLNNSTFANAYSSGGTAVHIGFATAAVLVDNTVFATVPDYTLVGRVESLSSGANARAVFTDAADSAFVTEQPVAVFQTAGAVASNFSADVKSSAKRDQVPDTRLGSSGYNMRLKVFVSGGAGASVQFSGWMEY